MLVFLLSLHMMDDYRHHIVVIARGNVWMWLIVHRALSLSHNVQRATCSSLAGHRVGKDVSPCLCHIARWLLQLRFVFRAKEDHGQFAACSKCCSTSSHRGQEMCGLSRLMHDDLHWLAIPQRVQYKLVVTVHRVVFGIKLRGTLSTTVCQFPNFLVASICDLPEVINCQFLELAVAPSGPVCFLLPDHSVG